MFKRVEKWRKEDGTQCQGDLKAKGERERLLKWTKVKKSNYGNQQQAVAQKLKTP